MRDGAACLSPKWNVREMASSDSPTLRKTRGQSALLKYLITLRQLTFNTFQVSFLLQSLKPFISYFPLRLWLTLLVALVLHYLLPDVRQLFDMVINFCLLYFLGKIATVIHEAGHLTVAHWVGATPKRMTLGWGHEVHRTYWRNIKIVLKSNPMGGFAMAIFKDMPWLKLKFIAFILGGV